jgi:hypothetical protein
MRNSSIRCEDDNNYTQWAVLSSAISFRMLYFMQINSFEWPNLSQNYVYMEDCFHYVINNDYNPFFILNIWSEQNTGFYREFIVNNTIDTD